MAAEDISVDPEDRQRSREDSDAAPAAQLHAAQTTPAQSGDAAHDPLLSELASTRHGQAADDAHDAWIGRVLDERYHITERLGEGGMGAVFVAQHLKLKKPVAVKIIRAELAGNGEVAARFAREAMATAQFEHPHVASAIDFGTLPEGGAYFVMQLVRGVSLRELLDRRGALPWPLACELLSQVADALSAARGAGIVHRDLKPENILVETREDGSYLAKILDFGIAHVMHPVPSPTQGAPEKDRALTRVGTVMGTPGYMSPEQAVGDRVDHRTDLYALGVVLWECLTGKPLWEGADVMAIITRQLREPVTRPRELLGDPLFPRTLDDLVLRLCERSPEQRPASASLVRDELRAVARQRMTPAVAIAEHARLTLTAARRRFLALPTRSRALFLAASAALLLALVTLVWGRRGTPTAAPAVAQVESSREVRNGNGDESSAQPVAQPSLTDRALQLAQRFGREPAPPKPEAKPAIPKELEPDVQVLIDSNRASDRRRAASKVLRWKGPNHLPAYVMSVARLEHARSCRDRQDAISELDELQDPRCLPALRRITDAAKSGCGFLGLSDCYGCVRAVARDAIARMPKRAEP